MSKVKIKVKKKSGEIMLDKTPNRVRVPKMLSDKEREMEMMKELNKKGAMPPSQKNVG